jgi:hypothetical protein
MTNLLGSLPQGLRDELFKAFNQIVRNFRERRWEPSELNGGKLCEVAYSILLGHTSGAMPAAASKPRNMVVACQGLEKADPQKFSRSVRIQIPRMLIALYEIRNNRGVGHVGGDVDPNAMDASAVLAMSKWICAEIIRIFHSISTEEAEKVVEHIVDRTIPVVWVFEDRVRILDPKLPMATKALVVLYYKQGWLAEDVLVRAVEHSNPSVFRRDVLRRCHKGKLLEYDVDQHRAMISPLGVVHVERTVALAKAV